MEENDTNIFMKSIHDQYTKRPLSLEDICLASFSVNIILHAKRMITAMKNIIVMIKNKGIIVIIK